MSLYLTFTRARLAALCAAALLLIAICGEFSALSADREDAATNAQRVAFAESIGCSVDETPLTERAVQIPQTFSDVYEGYNALQRAAGYDLSEYRGCAAVMYSYAVRSYRGGGDEMVLNLLVYRGRIIGGDISSTALDGVMLPLHGEENTAENGTGKTG